MGVPLGVGVAIPVGLLALGINVIVPTWIPACRLLSNLHAPGWSSLATTLAVPSVVAVSSVAVSLGQPAVERAADRVVKHEAEAFPR